MTARTVPAVQSFSAGQKLTATMMNNIASWQSFWSNKPMFRMYQSAPQSIPNAAQTIVTMDTPVYDTDGGRAAFTPWGYAIPTGMTGRWKFLLHIPLSSATAQERDVFLFKNGAPVVTGQETLNTGAITSEISILTVPVNAGDVMTAAVYQQSGGAVNTFVGTDVMPYFEGSLESLANP